MSTYRKLQIILFVLVISLLTWAWCPQTASAASSAAKYRPVSPDELKMTEEPAASGAPAIILYREVYRDDNIRTGHEDSYFRIKILTEEGRKHADIEIPYNKDNGNITGVHARTIKPDGSIVDFDGKVFTKTIVKAQRVKVLAKTFTLPGVEVGCIIEYFYTIDLAEYSLFASNWIVSDELFTKAADFSLKPYADPDDPFRLRWVAQNMPTGSPKPVEGSDHIFRVHVTDVPAFVTEEFMPPEKEEKSRVDFIYTRDTSDDGPSQFWSKVGKNENGDMEKFLGKPKNLEHAVAEIVSPSDAPEVKLQKIYARVQQMRNTSFEEHKTEAEERRAKEKSASNAEDAWKKGFADGPSLTWVYLALVRAAGFNAYGVMVPNREDYFFDPKLMQRDRLDEIIVLIKLNGKNIYCDPGSAFTPYGLLPWMETGIDGLQLDKKEPVWVPSLVPTPDQARTERRAKLTLSDGGDLEGTLSVTYTGIEAAHMRLEERHADDTARKKYLEDLVRGYIPASCEAKLTNQPDWKNPEAPLVAELSLKVPGWASGAGRHFLLPAGLFGAHEKHLFDHAERIHPIYVEYPFADADSIDIQLPAGWQVSSLPKGWQDTGKVVTYNLSTQNKNGALHLERTLTVNFIFLDLKYYSALREYFQEIKSTDDQQIVVDPAAPRAEN